MPTPLPIRIDEPTPFGDVTIAPRAMTGRPETELARSMAEALLDAMPAPNAAFGWLRQLLPATPLRAGPLAALMRR